MLVLETVLVMETCAYNREYTVVSVNGKMLAMSIVLLRY